MSKDDPHRQGEDMQSQKSVKSCENLPEFVWSDPGEFCQLVSSPGLPDWYV